jgi:hypothetical protein
MFTSGTTSIAALYTAGLSKSLFYDYINTKLSTKTQEKK